MLNIEYKENLEEEFYKIIDDEFNKFAVKNEVVCNYTPFSFIAKEDEKFVGIITGNSYYKEVHISDLIILDEFYKKCGFEVEFIRKNKKNSKLDKYYLVKYFGGN